MVATSSGHSNVAFCREHGLDVVTPDTLGDALEQTHRALNNAELFYGHGSDSAWDEAVFLVLSAAGLSLSSDDKVLTQHLSHDVWETALRWLRGRIEDRQPLPYLTGRAWFAGLEFHCDKRALVPRSPLAEVIRNEYRPWYSEGVPNRLLDLCCGGGCIGIAAAVYQPGLEVLLADIDHDALALAQENIALHEMGGRVRALQSDLMDSIGDERFDIILCNPPYVDAADLASMPQEYQCEPPRGLGSGDDGLDLARRILRGASQHLSPQGLLFLELGNSWAALDDELSGVALTWLEFSEGGHGVLLVRAQELPDIVKHLAL
ncbi:50S ribosomal protein L3 N(5)-glutamine methyltransferase [Congregibacter variabilis]|uniref:50S ribosomal protein L3 N(5)-glutamine methyltransferase n=1 Tax=Congregibacter variabilis TaxID=3081200 RepID=A0ABZ0I3C7_9GAMM|nr:50S ribosomal protein L3 N(5)-glutamine methyltransferase [Congregibacter sp. IMCC43200]